MSKRKPPTPKPFEDLTITDDYMFHVVMSNPERVKPLLEMVIGKKIRKIVVVPEKTKKTGYRSRGIRMDVYIEDDENTVYDVEMETTKKRHFGKRFRYYQSAIDVEIVTKGQAISKLKESYILFICKHDPFKNAGGQNFALSRYTFRNVCDENKCVNLDDKTLKVVYNATAYEKERDEKVRAFLKFVCTNDPGEDEYSNSLFATVEKLKVNEKFRLEYAAMNIHNMDLIRESKKEGRQEKAVEAARSFYANGVSVEIIAKSLNMTVEQVKEIVSGESEAQAQTN